jgi:hypothetical protein
MIWVLPGFGHEKVKPAFVGHRNKDWAVSGSPAGAIQTEQTAAGLTQFAKVSFHRQKRTIQPEEVDAKAVWYVSMVNALVSLGELQKRKRAEAWGAVKLGSATVPPRQIVSVQLGGAGINPHA